MSETIITMADGSKWRPSTSIDRISCVSCDNEVDTEAEILSYPSGNCPNCGNTWTGGEKRSTMITVTMPQGLSGGAG